MIEKIDKETRIRFLNSAHMLGFGLWFAMLLFGVFLPEEDLSERGQMWLIVITMTYAVLHIAVTFWSGYSRKRREMVNADPQVRKGHLSSLRSSAVFGFVFMLVFWLLNGDSHWTTAVLQALVFAALTSLVTYLMDIRKTGKNSA